MAKIFNITDKLSADSTAILEVFDKKLEFKTDAETVFTALEIADATMGVKERYKALQNLIFTEEAAAELDTMKLSFKSYQTVVETAFNLAIGREEDEETQGEPQTQATT